MNTYGFRAAESFPLHRDLAVAAETGWYACVGAYVCCVRNQFQLTLDCGTALLSYLSPTIPFHNSTSNWQTALSPR